MNRVALARRTLASAASLGIACAFGRLVKGATHLDWAERLFFGGIVAVPALAAAAIWIRRVELQLLARATWWALLLASCLLAATSPAKMAHFAGSMALLAAFALLAAGNIGLEPRGRFQPVAFRRTLLLSLMLAIADAGALALVGMTRCLVDRSFDILLLVVPMVVGVVGLLRLRTWGLLVSLGSNILVATLVSTRVVDLPIELRWLYVASAVAQLLVPMPMLISIVRRRPSPALHRH